MIKLLTHNDLDGVSCYILAKLFISDDEVDVEFCTHQNIEEKMSEVILNLNKYELVFMTDIHLPINYVQQFFTPKVVEKVHILDHHQTAISLNQYEFAQIQTYLNKRLTCGTELFFNYLKKNYKCKTSEQKIEEFVELVRSYDTWEWFNNHNQQSKDLNDLLYIKGINNFVKQITKALMLSCESLFSETDRVLLDNENQRIGKYIQKKSKEIQQIEIEGYQAGVVFAEQYCSELGNAIATEYPNLDFIAIVTGGHISYRTNKENVNVAKIAEKYGGGGHTKAAGSPISKEIKDEYLKMIFKRKKE